MTFIINDRKAAMFLAVGVVICLAAYTIHRVDLENRMLKAG